MTGAERLQAALLQPRRADRPALMPYLTSGFPERERFAEVLAAVAGEADAIELGVPFTDPMADGVSIQAASRRALEQGVSLAWILDLLDETGIARTCPISLMSYLNPLLAYGLDRLVRRAAEVGVCGLIVPDLPFEEGARLRGLAGEVGLGVVQLVTPVTPEERVRQLAEASGGFVYAVTMTGTTGGAVSTEAVAAYLDGLKAQTDLPVCAGFGIRSAEHVRALHGHAHGVIVGSALIDTLARGEDPVAFLRQLMD